MKAVIQLDTNMCVFYLSENAEIDFFPHLKVSNNSTAVGNFEAPFLNVENTKIISNMPEIDFNYQKNNYKIEEGQWVVSDLIIE
jgi:hypothetical protein